MIVAAVFLRTEEAAEGVSVVWGPEVFLGLRMGDGAPDGAPAGLLT